MLDVSFRIALSFAFFLAAPALLLAQSGGGAVGVFDGHTDVGTVLHPGNATYDVAKQVYTISGSGDNMWFGEDDFHFVWKKMSGDVALSADIRFLGATGNNHRKAVLMFRQSLAGDAKAVDVAWHGDGLTSLQYRDERGNNTHEVEFAVSAPARVRLERRGDNVYAFVADATGKMQPAGASTKLKLDGEFYVGLGVSAHDKNVTETAIFARVKLERLSPVVKNSVLYSTLETVTVSSTDRRVAYVAPKQIESPNWSKDGTYLLFNQEGLLQKFVLAGTSEPTTVPTGARTKILGDHGISPDGTMLQISDITGDGMSRIYVLPVEGGEPRLVTRNGPSYTHGWSPDGATLAFEGMRNGSLQVYTIPVAGGPETQLTSGKALNDGSEYGADGRTIYFASDRTGSMQLWRMLADGSRQEQVVIDDSNDWFPHVSPDGSMIAFLAYAKGVVGHPANTDVELRVMTIADKKVRVLAKLLGGRGTINGPSWSSDSKKLAFVSYSLIPREDLSP